MIYIWVGIVVLILMIWLIYKESTGFKVTEFQFNNAKLKKEQFKFVLISDLHDVDHGNDNEEVLAAIDKEKPDCILLAGDMITTYMEPSYHYDVALSFVKKLCEKYPVYYGIGNHESKFDRLKEDYPGKYEELKNILEGFGAIFLDDMMVPIEDAGINVYGLNLEHEYYRKFITEHIPDDYLLKKFGEPDRSKINILIAHNPEQFPGYAKWKPDYVLAGHVHGGIIDLPLLGGVVSPQLKLFPKYDSGAFIEDESIMILSRGLGSHTIPIRVFNKAEIVSVTIRK